MSNPEISLQLYSIRTLLQDDLAATLAAVRGIGFRNVELFDFVDRADELGSVLADNALSAPTAHAFLLESEQRAHEPGEVFEAAMRLGVKTVIDPFAAPTRWQDRDTIAIMADGLNALVPQAATHGLTIGYHNHGHEFEARVDDKHALEYFAGLLAPEVALEVDLYWAAAGGADLVPVVQRLGDRVRFVHVKDGTLPGTKEDQVPAGEGDVSLDAALDAASSAELAIVEFDAYRGDILQGVAASFDYLSGRGLR
jgi:sugar phosphate isomerase/epimerase